MYKHILAISQKEFKHLFRDKKMLLILIFFPIFLLIVFGYAISFDVKNINFAVYDQSKSKISNDFIEDLSANSYFNFSKYIYEEKEIKTLLDKQKVQMVLIFHKDFSDNFSKDKTTLQVLIDGVNGNTGSIIYHYMEQAVNSFRLKKSQNNNLLEIKPIYLYNKDLNSQKYLVPGLIAMILLISSVISVSLSLVKEKEKNTLEQINVSNISDLELIFGKIIPYIFLSFISALFILIFEYFLFDISIKGSLVLLFFCIFVFLFASVSFGIFISSITDSQQVAFTLATFSTLLPSMILSGFIFPIDGMPKIIQIISNITPSKFFIVILRGIILKGIGIQILWKQIVYLIIYGLIMIILFLVRRKKEI